MASDKLHVFRETRNNQQSTNLTKFEAYNELKRIDEIAAFWNEYKDPDQITKEDIFCQRGRAFECEKEWYNAQIYLLKKVKIKEAIEYIGNCNDLDLAAYMYKIYARIWDIRACILSNEIDGLDKLVEQISSLMQEMGKIVEYLENQFPDKWEQIINEYDRDIRGQTTPSPLSDPTAETIPTATATQQDEQPSPKKERNSPQPQQISLSTQQKKDFANYFTADFQGYNREIINYYDKLIKDLQKEQRTTKDFAAIAYLIMYCKGFRKENLKRKTSFKEWFTTFCNVFGIKHSDYKESTLGKNIIRMKNDFEYLETYNPNT